MTSEEITIKIKQKQENITSLSERIESTKEELNIISKQISRLSSSFEDLKNQEVDKAKQKAINERRSALVSRKEDLQEKLNLLENQKKDYIESDNSVENLNLLESNLNNLWDSLNDQIEEAEDMCDNVFDERLCRAIYYNLDRNEFDDHIESLDDLERITNKLTKKMKYLGKDRKRDSEVLMITLSDRLKYDVTRVVGIPIIIGYLILLFIFYKFLFPIFFIFLIYLSVDTIIKTNKATDMLLTIKVLKDNYYSISNSIKESVRNKYKEVEEESKNIFDEEIEKFNNAIKDIDNKIDNIESTVQDVEVDFKSIDSRQEREKKQLKDKEKELRETIEKLGKERGILNKEYHELVNNLNEEINRELMIFTKLDKDINTTLKYLPSRVPIARRYINNRPSIYYCNLPKKNTVFFYSKNNWDYVKSLVYNITQKLAVGVRPGIFYLSIIELKEYCSYFSVLNSLKQVFTLTDKDSMEKEILDKSRELYKERINEIELRELGIERYNKKLLEENSDILPYNLVFNLSSKNAINSIVNSEVIKTLYDVGVYNYSFIQMEDLNKETVQEIFDTVSEVYYVNNDKTIVLCNDDKKNLIKSRIKK